MNVMLFCTLRFCARIAKINFKEKYLFELDSSEVLWNKVFT